MTRIRNESENGAAAWRMRRDDDAREKTVTEINIQICLLSNHEGQTHTPRCEVWEVGSAGLHRSSSDPTSGSGNGPGAVPLGGMCGPA